MPVKITTLKNRCDFLQARKGRVFFGKYMLVQKLPNSCFSGTSEDYWRIGFTASKKTGKATRRNLAKRRMRHLFYKAALQHDNTSEVFYPGSYVMIAKKQLPDADYQDLQTELSKALRFFAN